MGKNLHLSGVGGWLGLLVIRLMILFPLSGIVVVYMELLEGEKSFPPISPQWQTYKQASWLIFIASSALSFAAGYRLWKIHLPESVKFAILALWLSGPLKDTLWMISAIVVLGNDTVTGGDIIASFGSIVVISSAIAAGIGTAYLKRSVRVKNTYNLLPSGG